MNQETNHQGPVVFPADVLDKSFDGADRIYLSGRLSLPQSMPHLDQDLEMGMSYYARFTCDKPHLHDCNCEFNYIAEGETHLLDLASGKVWVLPAGSAFILKPNTPYVTKHTAGTRVVFFKAPGGNDKRIVNVPPEAEEWMRKRI